MWRRRRLDEKPRVIDEDRVLGTDGRELVKQWALVALAGGIAGAPVAVEPEDRWLAQIQPRQNVAGVAEHPLDVWEVRMALASGRVQRGILLDGDDPLEETRGQRGAVADVRSRLDERACADSASRRLG